MVVKSRKTTVIVTGLMILLGVIHLAVGIGVTTRYSKYHDVFRMSVGLCGYNIAVGLFALILGLIAMFAVLSRRAGLAKKLAFVALVLAVFAIASFITGLVINSRSIDYMKRHLTYRMATYSENEESIQIIDDVQTNWQCCGTNLWLDWSRYALGIPGVGTVGSGGVVGRRRREESDEQSLSPLSSLLTPLRNAVRQKRQVISTGSDSNIYRLPTSTNFRLPLSCCKGSAATTGNDIGGFCLYSTNLTSTSFYVEGCLPYLANDSVSQVTGIVVINTFLAILTFVFFVLLLRVRPVDGDPNDPNFKPDQANGIYGQQQMQPQMQQQQVMPMQYQNPSQGAYANNSGMTYVYNGNPSAYYYNNSTQPIYSNYQ